MENSWSKENRLITKIRPDKIPNLPFVNELIDLTPDKNFITKKTMRENIIFTLSHD